MRTVERVSVSAFVDPSDHERLVERARVEERSVSAELRLAIREHLGERRSSSAPAGRCSTTAHESLIERLDAVSGMNRA